MIKDLKDLKKLIQLCRVEGLDSLRLNNIELKFGPLPEKYKPKSKVIPEDTVFDPGQVPKYQQMPVQALVDKIATDEMTEEQALFGSSDPSVWTQN